MVDANFEYADSRWQDIYLHLKKSGFDVYSPGVKTGDCTKEYIVVKNDGSSKLPNFRSEEHTSELQSHLQIQYAVFCLKK